MKKIKKLTHSINIHPLWSIGSLSLTMLLLAYCLDPLFLVAPLLRIYGR